MSKIKVINFDNQSTTHRTVENFPNIMRCGIFGPSGCGKTNVLLTILLHKKPLVSIYLCSRTAFQEKYKILETLIKNYNKNNKEQKIIKFVKFLPDKLPLPETIETNSIIIFDDVLTDNQDKIANFFMCGRHKKVSCFYLAQSYSKIPKKSGIRENFNFIILFKQDNVNLRQFFNEYICDKRFEEFKNLCNKCWKEKYGFITIDTEKNILLNKFDEQI